MKTILLLAGRSKRFWPLTDKALFPVAGKTLLEHQVQRLKDGGCTDIVLVGGKHNIAEAKTLFPDLPIVEQEDLDKGMQGALLAALPMAGKDAVMIVSSNDVIDPSGYRATREAATKSDGAVLAQTVTRYFPGGYLTVDGDTVRGIVEKPGEGKEPSNLVNIVVHVHNDASLLLQTLQGISSDRDDAYEQSLDHLFKSHTYTAVPYAGTWQPVKYPWHLLPAMQSLFAKGDEPRIHPTAFVHPLAEVRGNVVIEEGAKIFAHASVVGPATIGKHTIIGNGALVRESSIGEHCVIGFGSEVKTSVVHHHVWTHMTYIGDSIIGQDVSFGAGCITGNLRLDEEEISSLVDDQKIPTSLSKLGTIIGDHCRLGIRVGINPGVKIGRECFITGGAMIDRDIPEQSFVKAEVTDLSIRPNKMQTKKRTNPPA